VNCEEYVKRKLIGCPDEMKTLMTELLTTVFDAGYKTAFSEMSVFIAEKVLSDKDKAEMLDKMRKLKEKGLL